MSYAIPPEVLGNINSVFLYITGNVEHFLLSEGKLHRLGTLI